MTTNTPAAALANAMYPDQAESLRAQQYRERAAARVIADLAHAGWRVVHMEAIDGIGKWLSAALDDQNVCAEMKADIRRFFEAAAPGGE